MRPARAEVLFHLHTVYGELGHPAAAWARGKIEDGGEPDWAPGA
jgi:hypothetical protein